MAKEENKFSLRKKIYIQLNAFIDTNKIVQVPVDDRKRRILYSHTWENILCWPNALYRNFFFLHLDVPYIGDHWNIGRLILSIRNCINERSQIVNSDISNVIHLYQRVNWKKEFFKTTRLWSISSSVTKSWVLYGKKERRQMSQSDSSTKMITNYKHMDQWSLLEEYHYLWNTLSRFDLDCLWYGTL